MKNDDSSEIKVTASNSLYVFLLWRYLRNSWYNRNTNTIERDFLDLRKHLKPPEEFVSFTFGGSGCISTQFKAVISELFPKKINFDDDAIFATINVPHAYDVINTTRNLIEFKDEGSPHYGLYYLSKDEFDVIEAQTALLLLFNISMPINSDVDLLSHYKSIPVKVKKTQYTA